MGALMPVEKNIFLFQDTCNVYLVKDGKKGILIDYGSGDILDYLDQVGIEEITAVLFTHHHRDQAQGLNHCPLKDLKIWVPHMEQHFFNDIEGYWQGREIYNSYNNRQDRFSLLDSVAITGTLKDYGCYNFGNYQFTVLPTPGHTPGSVTLVIELKDKRIAFCGDLIYGPGKVWSLAATQWTYNGAEGVAAGIASLLDIKERDLDLLLPSHGEPIEGVETAIDKLVDRLWLLLKYRQQNPRLFKLRDKPFEEVTPHLLRNRASMADYYVLLAESGKALLIDFGYDFMTGPAAGFDRGARRPWLYTIPTLKEQYGVHKIDVVIPTHFHDDHVAGFNLLQEVEGTQVWAPVNFAKILEEPWRYNLPCLWYDPIHVDRVIPLEEEITWEEYSFNIYEHRGHTRYAVAIYFEVDGQKVLATGDQYQGEEFLWNYVYKNRYQIGDYEKGSKLYRSLQPDIILTGHWGPQQANDEFLARVEERDRELARLHRELLPLEDVNLGAEGFAARLEPYQVETTGGDEINYRVEVINPFPYQVEGLIRVCLPGGLSVDKDKLYLKFAPREIKEGFFRVKVPEGFKQRRARLAVDVTIGEKKFGQQAEALLTVR